MKGFAKFIGFATVVTPIVALSDIHFKLESVECTPGVDLDCIGQCTHNGCYAARTDGELNACLARLDPTCSVHVEGEIIATLDLNEDFCNVRADGLSPNGWLLIIPFMGSFAVMENPTLSIPSDGFSTLGSEMCSYLSNEIACQFSPDIATISDTTCINPTVLNTQSYPFERLFIDIPEFFTYAFAVGLDTNTAFCMPHYRECWAEHSELLFGVEFAHDFFGGSPVITSNIAASGNADLRII